MYAYTEMPGRGGAPDRANQRSLLTFDEFSKLRGGIDGLKSKNTVQRYHEIWAEHGNTDITPGAVVELPDRSHAG